MGGEGGMCVLEGGGGGRGRLGRRFDKIYRVNIH